MSVRLTELEAEAPALPVPEQKLMGYRRSPYEHAPTRPWPVGPRSREARPAGARRDEASRGPDHDADRIRRPGGAAGRPGGRGARARRRLGGDGDARARVDGLGDARRDDLPHARRDPLGAPAARDRRPALRLVRGLGRAGGRERDQDAQGGRRRLRQARRGGTNDLAGACDRRVEHRRDGAHRPDPAVGDQARWLSRPGSDRRTPR